MSAFCLLIILFTLLFILFTVLQMGSTKPDKTQLTPREAEIQELYELGLSRKEIAARLGITYYTVNHHLTSIRERAQGAAKSNDCSRSAQVEP